MLGLIRVSGENMPLGQEGTMRRWAGALLLCAGCSNAPLAGFLDTIRPSRARPDLDAPPPDGINSPDSGVLETPQFTPPSLPDPTPTPPPIQPVTPAPASGTSIGPLRLPNT